MALHLVGIDLDKTRSHYWAEAGKLIQLMRGIYVDADDDIEATVLRHAVRIVRYLHPQAYLSAASAVLLGPTRDGRLFLSARRKQRTRIRGLEIIQNEAPPHPSLGLAVVDDGMGELHLNVSSVRQRFLEAFRLRSEHAASINDDMREAIRVRLVDEYGNPKAAADALWALARENEWYREGEAAERFLLRDPATVVATNQAVLDLIVAWHCEPIGHLHHNGFEWRWTALEDGGPPLIRQTTPGQLPPFILALLPEGWLETVLKSKDERAMLRSGKRYMSNITIVERESDLATIPADVLLTRLEHYTAGGVFDGRYAGPGRGAIEESFERNLAQIYGNAATPRLSGVQIKAPMYLDTEGVLTPSTKTPFTHILKPAGTGGYQALPMVEWLAMELGRAVGFVVPATALMAMPDGMPPALIVERFDVRTSPTDQRRLALEDMCSVLDLPTSAKYSGTMERVARAVKALSTAPDEDLLEILKRALFAWLIADGDMHLKNMAFLKIADAGDRSFRTVRLAPLYDAVTTRVFPQLKDDHLAMKLNGKDAKLRRADFHAFVRVTGLRTSDADAAIDNMLGRMAKGLDQLSLPQALHYESEDEKIAAEMLDISHRRIKSFA